MSIKKILKYLLFLILITWGISHIYVIYDYNSSNYICKYVENEEDYQKKLILAENNSTLLFQLALYNYVCTKDKKEEERLQKKLKKLEELEKNMSK